MFEPTGLIILLLGCLLAVSIYNRYEIHKLRKELKDWQNSLFIPYQEEN